MLFEATAPNGLPMWIGSGEVLVTIRDTSGRSKDELGEALQWAVNDYRETMSGPLAKDVAQETSVGSWEDFKAEIALWQSGHRPKRQRGAVDRQKRFHNKSKRLKQLLAARDGMICQWPGCRCTEGLHVDHIIPISKNGTDNLENLQLLCPHHNAKKGRRTCNMKLHEENQD